MINSDLQVASNHPLESKKINALLYFDYSIGKHAIWNIFSLICEFLFSSIVCSNGDDEQLKNLPTNVNHDQIVASKTDDKKTDDQGFKELIMMKTNYSFDRMSFPGKRIYIFPNHVLLTIKWCEFLKDVQFIFVNGADIYFEGNVFRGSALLECFKFAKSTIVYCRFYKSVYNISHEKAELCF